MSVVHRVTGYNKASEVLEREFDVPDSFVVSARRLAEAPADYRAAPGAFPLSADAVRRLAGTIKLPVDQIDDYDWFLEPFDA